MKKYTAGIDYGTLSARAVLIDTDNGNEIAESEYVYPSGVMDTELPDGTKLENGAAFQNPYEYLEALSFTLKEITKNANIEPKQIAGLGIDFTACTVLPVDENFEPLCNLSEFKSEPQAYVKLWKHASAQKQADCITKLAIENNEPWLNSLGGKVSSQWMFPKMLETLEKAPQVFEKARYFLEAADWLIWKITGNKVRSNCMAGFKGMWTKKDGYPKKEFLGKIHSKFYDIAETKLSGAVMSVGENAGNLNEYGCMLTGLTSDTAVSVPVIDAHAGVLSAGICDAGKLMLILGTSACHIVLGKEDIEVPGICGKVPDGIIPGFIAYEAGQICVGDLFSWFIENCVPKAYCSEAEKNDMNIFDCLEMKASEIKAGESRIVALDWWNGNRTPYSDSDLTGAIFGLTLTTKPHEIYRALIEAVAFGTKVILDLYEENGVKINEIYAGGGITQKNKLLMQIYSDVTGREIKIIECKQAGAAGSAILAAYAGGCCGSVAEAVRKLAAPCGKSYKSNLSNTKSYERLYRKYRELSELFGVKNKILKELKEEENESF